MNANRLMQSTAIVTIMVLSSSALLNAQESPYVGFQDRDIKALSQDQINSLLEGRGMSLALAAELNSFPGPRHVLDLADSLELTDQQREQTQELFSQMQSEARALGVEIVRLEAFLDSLFAHEAITAPVLAGTTANIASRTGELRNVHLRAHLVVKALLTDSQVAHYSELRGYADSRVHGQEHAH